MIQLSQKQLDTIEQLIYYYQRKEYEAEARGDDRSSWYNAGRCQGVNQMWHILNGSKNLDIVIAESTGEDFNPNIQGETNAD